MADPTSPFESSITHGLLDVSKGIQGVFDGIGSYSPPQYDIYGLPILGTPNAANLKSASCLADEADDERFLADLLAGKNPCAIDSILTPVQLAAVFEHETVDESGSFAIRLLGAVRMMFAIGEIGGGLVLAGTPEPTLLTKVASAGVLAYSVDQFQTAWGEMETGIYRGSLLNNSAIAGARSLGASQQTAEGVGIVVEGVVPIGLTAYLNAVRLAAVRAGRINLAMHEKIPGQPGGGHTLEKHVFKDEAYLKGRVAHFRAQLAADPAAYVPDALTSFINRETAEIYISKALRRYRYEIEDWARTAAPNKTFRRTYDAKTAIGFGIVLKTEENMVMTKVTIRIKKTPFNGMPYFLLTAFCDI